MYMGNQLTHLVGELHTLQRSRNLSQREHFPQTSQGAIAEKLLLSPPSQPAAFSQLSLHSSRMDQAADTLSQVRESLGEMHHLAFQATDPSLNRSDRHLLQEQMDQIGASIHHTLSQGHFNEKPLFRGEVQEAQLGGKTPHSYSDPNGENISTFLKGLSLSNAPQAHAAITQLTLASSALDGEFAQVHAEQAAMERAEERSLLQEPSALSSPLHREGFELAEEVAGMVAAKIAFATQAAVTALHKIERENAQRLLS